MLKTVVASLLFCLLACVQFHGQVVFCPPGALWTGLNSVSHWYPGASRKTSIVYTGDTIAGLDTLKKLKHSQFYDECNFSWELTTYLKQKGDTVFMKSKKTYDKWEVLYNFAAKAGDSWYTTFEAYGSGSITFKTIVDSAGSVYENGMWLKQLHVRTLYPSYFIPTRQITERYGTGFLFAFHFRACIDADRFLGTLCYSDNQFGTKYFTALPCDYENPVDLPDNTSSDIYRIFPSLVTGDITILNAGPNTTVIVTDIVGKRHFDCPLNDNRSENLATLDLSALPVGVYFLTLIDDKKERFTKKIVKH